MITIEVGPGDTAEIIAQRYPDVFDWREGVLVKRAIPIYPMPQLDYREPVKVKPRSKRGQRKRTWR